MAHLVVPNICVCHVGVTPVVLTSTYVNFFPLTTFGLDSDQYKLRPFLPEIHFSRLYYKSK